MRPRTQKLREVKVRGSILALSILDGALPQPVTKRSREMSVVNFRSAVVTPESKPDDRTLSFVEPNPSDELTQGQSQGCSPLPSVLSVLSYSHSNNKEMTEVLVYSLTELMTNEKNELKTNRPCTSFLPFYSVNVEKEVESSVVGH